MPFSYGIDAARGVGLLRFSGTLTGPDLVRATHDFYGDAAWQPTHRALWDTRAVERLIIEPTDTTQFVAALLSLRPLIGDGKTAAVTATVEVYFIARLIRELSLRNTDRQVEVFERLEDALAWLGLEEIPPELAQRVSP